MNCADEYRKNIAEDRRDSLSFRNAEGKCQREFQAEVNADECNRVHESYELKWSGKRDADEYRKKVTKERSYIFALRNAEGKCLSEIQAEINADECQRAHESYDMKCAGERDADEHRKQMTNTIPTDNYDAFITWIKSNNMINLISNAAVVHIAYEGITNFVYLNDFDKKKH